MQAVQLVGCGVIGAALAVLLVSVCFWLAVRVGGQHDLRMDNAALPGVIMGQAVPFIRQFGSASVGGCGNGRTACAALDDTDGDMTEIYGEHLLSVRG